MRTELEFEYEMQVAHRLTRGVPERHKCRRPHGHRYVMTITVEGEISEEDGMLIEYDTAHGIIAPIWALVDHHDLNTLNERCSTALATRVAENPTVELLACWFAARLELLKHARPGQDISVTAIRIEEDSKHRTIHRPERATIRGTL